MSTTTHDQTPEPAPAPKLFGPVVTRDILTHAELAFTTDYRRLAGDPKEEPYSLAPHEYAVVCWVRKRLEQASNPFQAANVGVLVVGEANNANVVDHQFDHCGGGITSVMRGLQIAHGEFAPLGMIEGDDYTRGWEIIANELANQSATDPELVICPRRGELGEILDDVERTRGGYGDAQSAKEFLAAFPGHEVKLVSAWFAEVEMATTAEEVDAFFAKHGELTPKQAYIVVDTESGLDSETHELLLEYWKRAEDGWLPGDLLKNALKLAIATDDARRAESGVGK